ncbi:MAG: hypothetical protein C4551_00510 [Bacillota bacterium]|nr:MAG: hypothetical protein C4551_00510 [Bacillota bacterium]
MIPREALRRVGPEWRRAAALVALGFACGVAVGIAVFSVRLDMISLEREQLLVKSTDLEIQVERLQERLGKVLSGSYGPVVSEVDLSSRGWTS